MGPVERPLAADTAGGAGIDSLDILEHEKIRDAIGMELSTGV